MGSPVPWNLKLDGQTPDLSIPERVETEMPVPARSSIRAYIGPSGGTTLETLHLESSARARH
jgi:hypothetical protein